MQASTDQGAHSKKGKEVHSGCPRAGSQGHDLPCDMYSVSTQESWGKKKWGDRA